MRKLPGVSRGGVGGSRFAKVGATLLSVALALLSPGGLESRSLAGPAGTAGCQQAVRLNKSQYPRERALLLQASEQRSFPLLKDHFEVLGPSTHAYNCISNTLGNHKNWVNPRTGPAAQPLQYMDQLYAARGFHRAPTMNFSLESGKRKIVIYATTRDGNIIKVTHAAVQLRDGTWSSKLGSLCLIRHPTLATLTGPSYGRPVAVYVANR